MHAEIKKYCSEWPEPDRTRWLEAIGYSDDADDQDGTVAHWREQTKKDYTVGYTHALRWLKSQRLLKRGAPPDSLWSPKLLLQYTRDLHEQDYGSASIHSRLFAIERVLSQVAPGYNKVMFKSQLRKLSRDASTCNKRDRIRQSLVLRRLGCSTMDNARKAGLADMRNVIDYRTGMQIALLAIRPLRLKNFASLEIGRHIQDSPTGGYWIEIPADETKKSKALSTSFPSILDDYYDFYVHECRARLMKASRYSGPRLWVSRHRGRSNAKDPGAQSPISIYKCIMKRTGDTFGVGINPHLFRDCLATSIAELDPAEWDLSHRLLGNSQSTVERIYDHADTAEAGRLASDFFDQMRSK